MQGEPKLADRNSRYYFSGLIQIDQTYRHVTLCRIIPRSDADNLMRQVFWSLQQREGFIELEDRFVVTDFLGDYKSFQISGKP